MSVFTTGKVLCSHGLSLFERVFFFRSPFFTGLSGNAFQGLLHQESVNKSIPALKKKRILELYISKEQYFLNICSLAEY